MKIVKKPSFNGSVKINWKTFSQYLINSKSEEKIIKDIINDYKNKKESDSIKKILTN